MPGHKDTKDKRWCFLPPLQQNRGVREHTLRDKHSKDTRFLGQKEPAGSHRKPHRRVPAPSAGHPSISVKVHGIPESTVDRLRLKAGEVSPQNRGRNLNQNTAPNWHRESCNSEG